jgi:anti-anti-sigma factor
MASELAVNRERADDEDRRTGEILAAAEFRVDVAWDQDTVRITPVGEVDLATIGLLRTQATEAMSAAPGRMILDLRETTFLDSSALHFAAETHEWAISTGTRFAIVPGPAVVQRTFEVAGLSDQLPFVDVPRAS